jgi:hypothetical protein
MVITVVNDVAGNLGSGYSLAFISAAFVLGIVLVIELKFAGTASDDCLRRLPY